GDFDFTFAAIDSASLKLPQLYGGLLDVCVARGRAAPVLFAASAVAMTRTVRPAPTSGRLRMSGPSLARRAGSPPGLETFLATFCRRPYSGRMASVKNDAGRQNAHVGSAPVHRHARPLLGPRRAGPPLLV